MRYARTFIFLLLFKGAGAQAPPPSPEQFINEIFPKVIDSTKAHYFLIAGTDTCRFVKYNYDDWADYHLAEPVQISILNELAEKVYRSNARYLWKQDSLTNAICITRRQADSILYLDPNPHVFSFSLPQFTDDGQYAVIDLNMICGARCGVGTTYIFRRRPSGWKVVGEYTNWGTPAEHRIKDPHTSH